MVKKNVSARVPPPVADGIDEYAEEWNLNRTDAMTVLLRYAVSEWPTPEDVDVKGELAGRGGAYTLDLGPETREFVDGMAIHLETTPNGYIRELIRNEKEKLSDN